MHTAAVARVAALLCVLISSTASYVDAECDCARICEPRECQGGQVMAPCACRCWVCAKVEGERCGEVDWTLGTGLCDVGLECDTSGHAVGVCENGYNVEIEQYGGDGDQMLELNSGSPLVLKCRQSDSTGSIKWYKDGASVTDPSLGHLHGHIHTETIGCDPFFPLCSPSAGDPGVKLEIQSVHQSRDSGLYKCVGTQGGRTSQDETYVSVSNDGSCQDLYDRCAVYQLHLPHAKERFCQPNGWGAKNCKSSCGLC